MARPVISPMSVHATAPEAFEVLNQRMKGVEEQTNTLLKELATLGGGNGHRYGGNKHPHFICSPGMLLFSH